MQKQQHQENIDRVVGQFKNIHSFQGGKTMKKYVVLMSAIIFLTSGCATIKEHKKTAIGSAVGAAVGAGLGYAIGKGGGAGVGATVGALAGGTIGYMFEKQEKEFKEALADSEAASIRREQRVLAEANQRDQEVLVLSFQSDFWFDFDSAVLKPAAYREIDRVAAVLNRYPDTFIRVEGHTDSIGSELYNLELSERRAMAVKNALVARNVASSRIETVGFGEGNSIADNHEQGGRQLNRRVEIVIVPPAEQA
jgi:outer membrane protein OmpA-like peptidoglycan-associated protein